MLACLGLHSCKEVEPDLVWVVQLSLHPCDAWTQQRGAGSNGIERKVGATMGWPASSQRSDVSFRVELRSLPAREKQASGSGLWFTPSSHASHTANAAPSKGT